MPQEVYKLNHLAHNCKYLETVPVDYPVSNVYTFVFDQKMANALTLCIISTLACLLSVVSSENLKLVTTNSRLPTGLNGPAVVYDGADAIYTIGGYNGWRAEERVFKYSLRSGAVETVGTFMPIYMGTALMAAQGEDIIYFGGYYQGRQDVSSVYSFSTRTGATTLVGSLPRPSWEMGLAWDPSAGSNGAAYLFGGLSLTTGIQGRILRYDAATHQIEEVGRLPEPKSGIAAVWDSTRGVAFLHAGLVNGGWPSWDILQYSPTLNTTTRLEATLPNSQNCAVLVDQPEPAVYLSSTSHGLVKFDLYTEEVTQLPVEGWPTHVEGFGCVYVHEQERIYIVGGAGRDVDDYRDEIAYIQLSGGEWRRS